MSDKEFDELEFSHYEQCYDKDGWMWVKAWYWSPTRLRHYWFYAD